MKDKEKNKKVYPERGRRVFVAMSGGVDSSVAAALLKKQGYEISGVFMKLFDEAEPARAEKVARKLGIAFKVFDFRKEFKEKVIDYFLKGYGQGITPNPCVICNREIKFGLFLERALALGADYIATGHYIKKSKIKNQKSKIIYKLLKAKDEEKDQSYFLWTLTQEKLKKILFPMGDYTKKEVRKMAKKFGISDLIKKESEDICFLEGADLCGYLKTRINTDKGKIMTAKGKVLGEHNGLAFYTIGQRRGIKIAAKNPYYVIEKDIKNNTIIVSQNPEDLLSKDLIAKDVNWISGLSPKLPLKIMAKIRYRHESAPAIINNFQFAICDLQFKSPQRAITPGQSVVFYLPADFVGRRRLRRPKAEASAKAGKGERVLGGGIIEK